MAILIHYLRGSLRVRVQANRHSEGSSAPLPWSSGKMNSTILSFEPSGDSQTAQTVNAVDYIVRKCYDLYATYKSVIQATAIFNTMIQKPG